jgi:hypothetical protein
MGNNIIKHMFQLAAQTAKRYKKDRRIYLHGAIGIRRDGTIVTARNSATDTVDKRTKTLSATHAETRLCKKLDMGSTIYVVRISRKDGLLTDSKPCNDCIRSMKRLKVKTIYYSITPNEFGTIHL